MTDTELRAIAEVAMWRASASEQIGSLHQLSRSSPCENIVGISSG